ncbi:AAA family ATPase [Candidatus Uhrbacteria bacterium]|nr:AAA family ATPase [Candidatus Uhrbacteria bacterium]
MTQAQALSVLKSGANVFLTGEPGSGKTFTANEYVSYSRARGIETAVTASTGIAATHMNGMTIHSWSGIGIKDRLSKHDLDSIAKNKRIAKRIQRAQILIIEEISMLPAATFCLVDSVCRKIKQNTSPFGGLQVVCVGDFFQLPPIMKTIPPVENAQISFIKDASPARFAYDSQVWKDTHPLVCYLTEQHRQDDGDFLNILSAIRRNSFTANHLRILQTRKIEYSAAPKGVPKLFSHNANVDYVNEQVLVKIHGTPHTYDMSFHGPDALTVALKKWCLSPAELQLKTGAAVMFTKNNQKEGFVNGTLGTVEGFNTETGYPKIRLRSGRRIEVSPAEWAIEEDGITRARISQLPLRLAWAITVHKSQGMSLDEAVMDLSSVFEFGQGYVALSRVRRLSGLYLLGWNERAFQVHPEVFAQDEKFRADSEGTLRELPALIQKTNTPVCIKRGSEITIKNGYDHIREKHEKAYRPWDAEQDDMLRQMYLDGSSLSGLAQTFSRTVGSIRSRLAKFNLLDTD